MSKYLVAAAQLGPVSPTRAQTAERIVRLVEQAGREGVRLAVFSELALSSYFATVVHDDVTPFLESDLPSPETAPIFRAAATHGVAVVLPFAERQGATCYNSAALIDTSGREVGRYRKTHIPGQVEPADDGSFRILEKRYFTPGDLGFPVYDSPVGRLGMLICYDRRFPEAYRCLALSGAEVIAIGYNTPVFPGSTLVKGQAQSELCMRAGAYANGVHVIAAGKAGVEGGVEYIGGSVVIDPSGEILRKAATDGDELVLAEIDAKAAADLRGRLNLEINRRPDLYGGLVRTRVPA
jgi:predicted amidohydrolase